MAAAPLLQVRGLQVGYPGQPPFVRGFDGAIGAGATLLHGDTGSGESTLLRVLAGQLPAAAGSLSLGGVRLDEDAEGYRRQVFFVDPSTDEFDALGVEACTAVLRAGDEGFDEPAWRSLVEGFGLAPHLGKSMYMLSTGSKRKVWLAAGLASSRPLLLLDEPGAALDGASLRRLWRAIEEQAARPARAVIVASSERIDVLQFAATLELPLASR